MSRRKSSKQLRNMVIALIVLIIVILIAFIVFIFNVDVKKNSSANIRDIISNKDEKKEDIVVDGVIAPDELVGAEYESYDCDNENTFEIRTVSGKVYFNVLDEDKFNGKYNNAKLDLEEEKEIATHDYKIKEVYIQKCNNKEYLLVTMEDGSIGIMDIKEAINENVFRIKKELITLNKPISRIVTSYRTLNNNTEEATILVSSNGQMYDLQKFVE